MPNTSFTPISRQSASLPSPAPQSLIARAGLKIFWAISHFIGSFIQQIAEIFAPLCLVLGIGWAALPHVFSLLSNKEIASDPQAREVVDNIVMMIPNTLRIGQHLLTPTGLITDGILLLAISAFGTTLVSIAARRL